MLYKRYKMLQKYINGEAQEEYKQGELISDVTFGTLSECNEGNQKPDETIEGNIYQWVTISDDYICNGKDKYTKEKEQTSSDGGKTWIDTGRTRQGDLLQANSDDCTDFTTFDCGIIFTDLNTNDHHFSTNSGARFELLNTQVNNANGYIRVNFRIHIKKNMNSYDWIVMGNGTMVASRYIGNVVNGQVITDYFEVPCGNYNFMLMIQEIIGDATLKYAQSRVTYICNDCSETPIYTT